MALREFALLPPTDGHYWIGVNNQGIEKRPDANADVNWHISMKPGKRKVLGKANAIDAMVDQVEKINASIRAKVEQPFRVIKGSSATSMFATES
jgi:hypothetical protein